MNLFRKFIIISLIFFISGNYSCTNHKQPSLKPGIGFFFGKTYNYNDILVKRVIDGDTLQLENGQRVRLIGIDTPEMHQSDKLYKDSQRTKKDIITIKQLGIKAYEFTRNLVEDKRVRLEFDVERYDKYGRLLAYVYLKDGTFVNAEIIKEGYANLMTVPPNVKYAQLFLRLYQEARQNKRGLWK
ncbi:MAG: thermonuclease family protein [Candidatus Omnitrophica bacterium]|nr:thermonuclease family protein [Candidatus Omnitrophota bacterium]